MPTITHTTLSSRATIVENQEQPSPFNPIAIIGFIFAGFVLAGIIVALVVRYMRKNYAAKRLTRRGAAFLDVKGLVRHNHIYDEKSQCSEKRSPSISNQFSRAQLGPLTVLPTKAHTHPSPPASPTRRSQPPTLGPLSSLISYPRLSLGLFRDTSPTSPTSRGFMLNTSTPLPANRQSRSSISSFGLSPRDITGGSPITDVRRVRQPFTAPVLPDELLATRIGERLAVLQSFDDGWCLVARKDPSSSVPMRRSLFGPPGALGTEGLDMGVIPAWCFVKPVRGMFAQRPMRGASLVPAHVPPPPSPSEAKVAPSAPMAAVKARERTDVISWSNF
ncbi:hypothetical protein HGRIS_003942 [Hohenbuehelia grisea]|uniref:SH3 domain-containing protein n=1 Tax=Hohenbuehelia grisea TaxID=104357 RepID=A0ABR3JH04_9AGAR